MTMKPKALKFRIRRASPAQPATRPAAQPTQAAAQAAQPPAKGLGGKTTGPNPETGAVIENATTKAKASQESPAPNPAPKPQATPATNPAPASDGQPTMGANATDINAIRHEGLTGRQLRLARRIALKQGLAPTSDFDAVRQLRQMGIDPFQRSAMLQLVAPEVAAETGANQAEADNAATKPQKINLPQTVPQTGQTLPSVETLSPSQRRAQEISDIQKDIQRRRRRKMSLLLTRLAFFVFLPTLIAGYYFYQVATPMFATKSEFLIIQADNAGGSGVGSFLSGSPFATSQDAIGVQGYLQSKEAMLRLDEDAGFKQHFTQSYIDPVQRLAAEPTIEEAFRTYRKRVKIGFDPTEGVIRMEVSAADPQTAKVFSEKLIQYAETRVNNFSASKRGDQMDDALRAFKSAETERRNAQERLVRLQVEGAALDPEGVIASLRTQISNIEAQITEKTIEISTLEANPRPNQAQLNGAQTTLRILEEQRALLNDKMTQAAEGETGLAEQTVRVQMAQADLATRDLLLQSALQQVEQTRMEANRQVRYLTMNVDPVASEEPAYPRAFENTVLAFLIFAGVYLMISLTASILREQVAS